MVHFSVSCSWYHKSDLTFYNDENDPQTIKPVLAPKPRRRPKTETPEQYEQRLEEWKELLPYSLDIKPKGNSITQIYYTEKILPGLFTEIQRLRLILPEYRGDMILQEDSDPSHGHRSGREANWIMTLKHPAQSPDLSPIEGLWAILKQRVRRRKRPQTIKELKAALREEWAAITMDEVRRRIAEMPARCREVARNGGRAVRSNLW